MQLKDFISVIGSEAVEVNHCNALSEGNVFVIESERDVGSKWTFIVPYYTVCVVAETPIRKPYWPKKKFREFGCVVNQKNQICIWKYPDMLGMGEHGICVAILDGIVVIEQERSA